MGSHDGESESYENIDGKQHTDIQDTIQDGITDDTDFYDKLIRNKKVVCLDLYGTLIYQQTSLRNKIKNYMKSKKDKKGDSYARKALKLFKKGEQRDLNLKSINAELPESHEDKLPESEVDKLQSYIKEDLKKVRRYRETPRVLKKLKKKYRLALISNISKEYEEPFKRLIKEGTFDYKAFSYSVKKSKPEPEIFETIIDQAKNDGFSVEDMVMIGDTRKHDMKGAEEVGMDRIFLDRKAKKMYYDENRKIRVIHTLEDLTKILV